jgi:hypothetical protein
MTANYIARVVESLYDKINIDEMLSEFEGIEKYTYDRLSDEWVNKQIKHKEYYRWLKACGLLETYCTMNMGKFKETELVYKWAKDCCIRQNNLLNEFRAYSWGSYTFDEWYKKRN